MFIKYEPSDYEQNEQSFRPGDIIARCFSRLGFKECAPCAKRKQRINLAWAWFISKLKGKF
jgi:hypothetical protein